MPTAASPEFIALCRAQLSILTDSLGASLSVVYMTDEPAGGEESKLIPIAVYPETPVVWSQAMKQLTSQSLSLPSNEYPKLLTSKDQVLNSAPESRDLPTAEWQSHPKSSHRQMLMPLVHEGAILGLLVTTREKRPWNAKEQTAIKHIAQTITLAGVLDRQRNWLTTQLQHQQQLHAQQQYLLHNILHQLRNPLTAIRTFGKLLIRRLQPGDKNQEVANSIVRESDRLQELLQYLETAIEFDAPTPKAVIDLTPSESPPREQVALTGSIEPGEEERHANLLLPNVRGQIADCQLTDTLHPLILSAQAIAQERNLIFHALIPPHLPKIRASAAALREVLSNLIDNALKYTPPGGSVTIRVKCHPETTPHHLTIAVRDTGLGIPAEDLEHLFERHYRGVQAQGDIPGTGLGLAIARELITQMQGTIEVKSPPAGCDRGTEFVVSLLVN
jgi:signal transduction histidine kinase